MIMTVIEFGAEIPTDVEGERPEAHEYLAIIEGEGDSWGAYVPDLPGLGVAAQSEQEARRLIGEAVRFHVEGMRAEGLAVPAPSTRADRVSATDRAGAAASDPLPRVEHADGRVVIEIAGGRWQGSAGDAERVLTTLYYALARARPGTNIASAFVNGSLWGGKFVETDPDRAIELMRSTIEKLAERVGSVEAQRPADADKP